MSTTTRRGLLAAAVGRAGDQTELAAVLTRAQLTQYTYVHVVAEVQLAASARATVDGLAAHERSHITALSRALTAIGGSAPPPPDGIAAANDAFAEDQVAGRLGQLRGPDNALDLLLDLERLTVGACYVALITVGRPAHARLIASIMASDAQHEALLGELITPGDIAGAIEYGIVQGLQ